MTKHPLTVAAVVVAVAGGITTALLLLLPLTAPTGYTDGSTVACGTALTGGPSDVDGSAACHDTLTNRRGQAFVVGLVTVLAAGGLMLTPGARHPAGEHART